MSNADLCELTILVCIRVVDIVIHYSGLLNELEVLVYSKIIGNSINQSEVLAEEIGQEI